MTIPLFSPQISVGLFKLTQRNHAGLAARAAAAPQATDLTPYLGDQGNVQTVKSVVQPCGAFAITFADQLDKDIGDSVYALAEPMDLIEIRASRVPHIYAGAKLPLIMRGFVSEIRRTESMGGDGKPVRRVTIRGQDAGKLLQIYQVLWEVAQLSDSPFLNEFKFQTVAGLQPAYQPVAAFFEALFLSYINQKVAGLNVFAGGLLQPFKVNASVTQGYVSPTLVGGYQGPLWGLVEQFCDRPWNEAFVRDTEAGPTFVHRPAPYFDIGGNLIGDAADPGEIRITDREIVSLDVARGDARVANFFWCPPDASSFDSSTYLTASRLQNKDSIDEGYGNDDPRFFGLKKMTAQPHLIPLDSFPPDVPAPQRGPVNAAYQTWYDQRAGLLRDMNRDNSVFEEGGAVVQGAEWIKPGYYLKVKRGTLVWKAYMPEVAHTFSPFGSWTSTVKLERGTAFLARLADQTAPFWDEGRSGPYDNAQTGNADFQNNVKIGSGAAGG